MSKEYGQMIDSYQALERFWRSYPFTPNSRSCFFAVASDEKTTDKIRCYALVMSHFNNELRFNFRMDRGGKDLYESAGVFWDFVEHEFGSKPFYITTDAEGARPWGAEKIDGVWVARRFEYK